MTLVAEAKAALLGLHALTVGMKNGVSPDAYSVFGYQSDLVRLYTLLGEEMASRFGSKERAYLSRKIQQAKEYKKGRYEKLTVGDATEEALLAVEEHYDREIDAMETFELYRVMMKSLQNGFEHARSVASFVKSAEPLPERR